jgi:hypothetical protein
MKNRLCETRVSIAMLRGQPAAQAVDETSLLTADIHGLASGKAPPPAILAARERCPAIEGHIL